MTDTAPEFALSLRQPWAWLVVNGHKTVENRTWRSKFRGPVFIHASRTMTASDYERCASFVRGVAPKLRLPKAEDLPRGGIVGRVEVLDCVVESEDAWFTGPVGYVVGNPTPLSFVPCLGKLGFFAVEDMGTK